MAKTKKTFETALEQLEQLVREIESGDLPLEKSMQKFEEGVKLSKYCARKLDEAENKINLLLEKQNGTVETVPFDSDMKE